MRQDRQRIFNRGGLMHGRGGGESRPLKFYAKSAPKMRKFFHQLPPNRNAYLSGAYL